MENVINPVSLLFVHVFLSVYFSQSLSKALPFPLGKKKKKKKTTTKRKRLEGKRLKEEREARGLSGFDGEGGWGCLRFVYTIHIQFDYDGRFLQCLNKPFSSSMRMDTTTRPAVSEML